MSKFVFLLFLEGIETVNYFTQEVSLKLFKSQQIGACPVATFVLQTSTFLDRGQGLISCSFTSKDFFIKYIFSKILGNLRS